MMVRKELGGYCPEDPLEFAFISTILSLSKERKGKADDMSRLQNLINKSK
ncbi:hypothetical protein LCGC14_1744100 [marine sediment metagenome]|uniref:Uncharacterized protein n=1 Tax=marine sediment metagenome TaxID=412755 RepID=A0A0F9H5V0_9ZZZZ